MSDSVVNVRNLYKYDFSTKIFGFKLEREEEEINVVRRIVCVLNTTGRPLKRIQSYHHPCAACSIHSCPPPPPVS